jgi:hypothetical protein
MVTLVPKGFESSANRSRFVNGFTMTRAAGRAHRLPLPSSTTVLLGLTM